MNRVRRGTPPRLLLQSGLLVTAIRLGLWLLPFRRLRAVLARLTAAPPLLRPGEEASADQIARAVRRASRHVPQASCLTQALATQTLLRWRGIPAHLHIGVAKDAAGRLEAHAWVESEGRVVIGGTALARYTPLAPSGLRQARGRSAASGGAGESGGFTGSRRSAAPPGQSAPEGRRKHSRG
jgi:hypothetical protein